MGIIYLITELILCIVFILKKKSNKEINIINFICVSIAILFCYNTFICYVITFFNIASKLWILSCINIIISIVLFISILRKKEIQKFYYKKKNWISIVIIAFITILIGYKEFGIPFNVNYETGDPSVHYLTAIRFAENEKLMPAIENEDDVYGSLDARKTVSYVNSGLIMKCLSKNLDMIECYEIFAFFGIFILFLTGISLFSALDDIIEEKKECSIALIIAIICMLGYPLNSLLFGFEYLSMSLFIITIILNLIINYFNKEKLDNIYLIIIMSLINFGLFCSYYMFVPFIFSAEWIYFCFVNYKKTNRIVTKEIIIFLFITLLLPFILGYIYHLEPTIYSIIIKNGLNNKIGEYSEFIYDSGFAVNGYIYVNLFSNMIIPLILPIAYLLDNMKRKDKKMEFMFIYILLFFCIFYIVFLLIGAICGKVSIYYLSKNYFALWIILAFCNYNILIDIEMKSRYVPKILVSIYIAIMTVYTIFSNTRVEYYLINPNENITTVMEIFGANKTLLYNKPVEFDQDGIEILQYVKENIDYNSKIEFVADENAYYWIYALLRYVNKEEKYIGTCGGQMELTYKWIKTKEKINKVDYIVYFKDSIEYEKINDILFENCEVIYENKAGGILKYNIE